MQEVVKEHILQKPSQANNLTLKQKGKQVKNAGRGEAGGRLPAVQGQVVHTMSFTRNPGRPSWGCCAHMNWSDNVTLMVPRHERWGRARGHSPPSSQTRLEYTCHRPLTMPFKRVCFLNNVQEIITPISNSQPKSIPIWPGSLGPGPLPFSLFHWGWTIPGVNVPP